MIRDTFRPWGRKAFEFAGRLPRQSVRLAGAPTPMLALAGALVVTVAGALRTIRAQGARRRDQARAGGEAPAWLGGAALSLHLRLKLSRWP